MSVDGVRTNVHGRHFHVTLRGAIGQTSNSATTTDRVEAGAPRTATLVSLAVDVARLQLADHVSSVGLGARVPALVALAEEARQGDRGEDADNQNDDEELDEGKTLLLIAQLAQH